MHTNVNVFGVNTLLVGCSVVQSLHDPVILIIVPDKANVKLSRVFYAHHSHQTTCNATDTSCKVQILQTISNTIIPSSLCAGGCDGVDLALELGASLTGSCPVGELALVS